MLHACNAVDGTGRKRFPKKGVADRFKSTIRESLEVLSILGLPGIDLEKTRFPLKVESHLSDKRPDIADVIYGVHRCAHGHGDELPDGYELTPYENGSGAQQYQFAKDEAHLPSSVVLGLLGVAVFASENRGQPIPPGYQLSWRDCKFEICNWWGRLEDFHSEMPGDWIRIEMDWGDWWDDWVPLRR